MACRRHQNIGLLALAAALALAGCASQTTTIAGFVPAPKAPPLRTHFSVGAARVDLTPIPGIGMNYSLNGYLSRGFWTRLYARAIYIEDATDETIVLVSSDLPHIPNGLGDRVAEKLSKLSGPDRLDFLDGARVVLAATHTHQGPENWFSSELYNAFPSPKPGFDPQLFDFIADRITFAIHEAYKNRKKVSKVEMRTAKLDHLFRNRSLEAFLRNGDSAEFLAANASVADDCVLAEGSTDTRACRAVRAEVEVVEFKDSSGARIASAVFLAAHSTVLDKETEVFSGDLFGVAASLIEEGRVDGCESYATPVVALFNGAQGDVSPMWNEKLRNRFELMDEDPADGLGLAVKLARFVCNKEPVATPTEIKHDALETRFGWLDLQEPLSATGESCSPWHEGCTEDEPVSGIPSAGGAQDGRTFFYELGLRDGLRSDSRMEHGRKVVGLDALGMSLPIAELLSSPTSVPKKVPLGLYRLGNLALVPLPGEFTTMMGHRIRTSLKQALTDVALASSSTDEQHVVLIGLANGHVSYVTTPEEYDAQFYEGAQNLYGAATGPVLQSEIEKLTTPAAVTGTRVEGGSYLYLPGQCRVAMPRDAGLPAYDAADGLENILMDLDEPDITRRDFPSRCWVDAIPALPKVDATYASSTEMCRRSVPYVWIEEKTSSDHECGTPPSQVLKEPCGSRALAEPSNCSASDPRHCIESKFPQDNCGLDIVTVLHGSYRDRTRWCAFWMPREGQDPADYQICVAGVTDSAVLDTSAPLAEFDKGGVDPSSLLAPAANAWKDAQECAGVRTRPVCEMP